MTTRVIYIAPGDVVEARFVHPDLPKNATEWRYQTRPSKVVMRLWPHRIAATDHSLDFTTKIDAWREK